LEQVLKLARGTDARVTAFKTIVSKVVEVTDPGAQAPSFDPTSSDASEDALALASVEPSQYSAALEAAVDASLVPIVCDPSQILVMFTVDASGQGKDGNGAPQFIRQPPKEGKIFLGITLDPTSPVPDSAGALRPRLTPNDPETEMLDDGSNGDEVAGDGVFTKTLALPRGMRVLYKYTDGSPNEGFTNTEEWPGNARILVVDDVLTNSGSGQPDCLVVRRDTFGDEASNKDFVNLNAKKGGSALGYDDDLGGITVTAPGGDGLLSVGGLKLGDQQTEAPLTPAGIAEARENGICTTCPAPLTVSADDHSPPRLVAASFLSTQQTRVVFSEDVDVQSAGVPTNYLLVDENNRPVEISGAIVAGGSVVLSHATVDPRAPHTVAVKNVADASLQQNVIAAGASVSVGPDLTPPTVLSVTGGSIVDVNPSARPADPTTGEVVIVSFSEELDTIAAEDIANWSINGLDVLAAFKRGRDVLLVTSQQQKGAPYDLTVGLVFDIAGNVAVVKAPIAWNALSLSQVTFKAVVDYAWRSVDGADKGLPPGDDVWLTGTVTLAGRAVDGGDLRVQGRSDVAGLAGYELVPTGEKLPDGAPGAGAQVYSLTLLLPSGTYAYKLAHGNADAAENPPVTLETVTKGLSTRNDLGGVAVDPITLRGADGLDYSGARLSLNGQDLPGPGVIFKRENPDSIVVVGDVDKALAPDVLGTWRDNPFGTGDDYDDGLVELPLLKAGVTDTDAPRLLGVRARDSESVLLSFDEAVFAPSAPIIQVTADDGSDLPIAATLLGQPLVNQIVVQTGAMANDTSYSILIGGIADINGNVLGQPVTAGFTSPAQFQPFTPIVDDVPPAIASVRATSPTEVEVTFSERVTDDAATASHYAISHDGGGAAPSVSAVRLASGNVKAILTTTAQDRQAPYTLTVTGVSDVANNTLTSATASFPGFGDFNPPTIAHVQPLSSTRVALIWDKDVTAATATLLQNYTLSEVGVSDVVFGASDTLKNAAFNATYAPLSGNIVVLTSSSPMTGGGVYTLDVQGVQDLSGNNSLEHQTFTAVAQPPTVDVILTYLISDTAGVVGVGAGGSAAPPSRAIAPSSLAAQREGVFVIGTALTDNGSGPIANHPFTAALGGFPADGAPLDGAEPQLHDDGQDGDAVAGDHIFSMKIANVPLGSTLSWKAFASFTTSFAAANPSFPGAAFADATPGPSVFGDGQEYPGNDNAVFLVGDIDGDGKIEIDNLFGDEITFKRKTGFPAFFMAVDRAARIQ
ncbi:MAG TPA: Ig-like domain-containing protein, partial [Myxococcota bacterium]